jgi:hypothetical protein
MSPDTRRIAVIAATIGAGFALTYGAVTANYAVLVVGIVLLILGPVTYVARTRR